MSDVLSAEDRAAILREFDTITAEPAAPDQRPVGCVVALLAIALLVTFPSIGRALGLDLPHAAALVIVAFLVLAIRAQCSIWSAGCGKDDQRELCAAQGLQVSVHE